MPWIASPGKSGTRLVAEAPSPESAGQRLMLLPPVLLVLYRQS
jgi:hypothetical protein